MPASDISTTAKPLAGKVALITGASKGIGAGIARRLARDGASVALTYSRGKDGAEATVKEILAAGGKAIAINADSRDVEAVRQSVSKTVQTFGRLDILVNNAGLIKGGSIEETTVEDFNNLFDVNVRAIFVASQEAIKHLPSGGRIINVGSVLGERVPVPGISVYSATKGAVKILTQALARELGSKNITVNNIEPGPIDTPGNPDADSPLANALRSSVPLGRYGRVDEVAALVSFIAGPESSYVNGANLTVDGGSLA